MEREIGSNRRIPAWENANTSFIKSLATHYVSRVPQFPTVWSRMESQRSFVQRARLTGTHADIRQRVYRGEIDSPKTSNSIRKAALSTGCLTRLISIGHQRRRLGVGSLLATEDPLRFRQQQDVCSRTFMIRRRQVQCRSRYFNISI